MEGDANIPDHHEMVSMSAIVLYCVHFVLWVGILEMSLVEINWVRRHLDWGYLCPSEDKGLGEGLLNHRETNSTTPDEFHTLSLTAIERIVTG